MHLWTIAGLCSSLGALSCSTARTTPAAPQGPPVVELTTGDVDAPDDDAPSNDAGDSDNESKRARSEIEKLLDAVPACPGCAPPQRSEDNLNSLAFEQDHYARRVVLRRSGDLRLGCQGPVVARGERAEIFERLTLPVVVETPQGCTHVLTEAAGTLLRVVVDSADLRLVPTALVRLLPGPTAATAPPASDDPLNGVWLWPGASVKIARGMDTLQVSGNAQGIEFSGYADARWFGNAFTPLTTKKLPETTTFIEGSASVRDAPAGTVIATVRAHRLPVPVIPLGDEATADGGDGERWLRVLIHEPLATTPTVSVIGYLPESSLVARSKAALFAGGLAATRTPTPSGSSLAHLTADTLLFSEAGVLTGKVLYDTDFVLLPDGRIEVPTRWGNLALKPQ